MPVPRNLPAQLSSFVGRARELAELTRLLRRSRLLTLTGPGGCGKSRLSLQLVAETAGGLEEGAWWVPLAPITDPAMLGGVLAQVLGVRPVPGESELDAVITFLGQREAVMVLDNCEHLLEEAARAAEILAGGCPGLRVLATSREPLRAQGETEWRVPSLSLPSDKPGSAGAAASDAVRLFVERAAQVRPGFTLTQENEAAILAICRELDGMPLAIELAAARLRTFSVEQIATRLADRFRLLTGGARTALARHQTLHASLDWSHELLSDQERTVFRRLGVFVGGFTLEAAERVCAGRDIDAAAVLSLVTTLVEKSLVQAEDNGPVVRYRLLETMRAYALDRLGEAGETERARDRHRDFYLEFAERIAPELLTPEQPEFLELLDPEDANFTLAIEHASATEPDKALRLSVALTLWWRLRSHFAQGEAGFARSLEAQGSPELRARALWGHAYLRTFAGALDVAFPAAQQALEAAEMIGDHSTAARALWLIGITTMWPDPIGSRPGLERALDLAVATGDEFARMHTTQALGMTHLLQEDHHSMVPFHEEALALAERLGQQDALAWHWIAMALGAWIGGDLERVADAGKRAFDIARRAGDIVTETAAVAGLCIAESEAGRAPRALEQLGIVRERAVARGGVFLLSAVDLAMGLAHAADGRAEQARSAFEALILQGGGGLAWALGRAHVSLAEVRRLLADTRGARIAAEHARDLSARTGDEPIAAEARLVLGRLAAARGRWAEAQRLLHDALPVAVGSGSPRLARVLEAMAEVSAGLRNHVDAARILGSADGLRRRSHHVPWPHQRAETAAHEQTLREELGAEAFERAFAEGEALTAEEVVAYLRRARGTRKRPATGWESLTPTELEVARLATAGSTNPQIAEAMFIARDTVRTHLSHIFTKLGLKNRAELAREVARHEGTAED